MLFSSTATQAVRDTFKLQDQRYGVAEQQSLATFRAEIIGTLDHVASMIRSAALILQVFLLPSVFMLFLL